MNDNARTIALLRAKALGIVHAIERMDNTERTKEPTGPFGKNYNEFRTLIAESVPSIRVYLPPAAEIRQAASGTDFTKTNYGEIWVYCSQISELLATESQA